MDTFSQAGVIEKPKIQTIKSAVAAAASKETNSGMAPLNLLDAAGEVVTGNDLKDIIVEGATGKRISFKTKSGRYVFNLYLKKDDQYQNWLYITPKANNEFDIEWNIRHPFFKPFIDEPAFLQVMENFVFALALSEIEALRSSVDGLIEAGSVRMRMNEILKDVVSGGAPQ